MTSEVKGWTREKLLEYREKVRNSPQHQRGVIRVKVHKREGKKCEAIIRKFRLLSDESSIRGGNEEAPTPLEIFLAGITMCEAATAAMIATEMGISYESLEINARATFDRRGIMNIDNISAAFQEVSYELAIKSSAHPSSISDLSEAMERRCAALNTLKIPVPVLRRIVHNSIVISGTQAAQQELEGTY